MTIQVRIPDDLALRLEQKARVAGLDREEYIRSLVSRDLSGPASLDEILRPFRAEVAASGLSDAELDGLFTAARAEAAQDESTRT